MNMLINHFIIASRAYSQQSPTCTRINNLVYIILDPTPMESHSCSLSADHVCLWKRFCLCSVLYSSPGPGPQWCEVCGLNRAHEF